MHATSLLAADADGRMNPPHPASKGKQYIMLKTHK